MLMLMNAKVWEHLVSEESMECGEFQSGIESWRDWEVKDDFAEEIGKE